MVGAWHDDLVEVDDDDVVVAVDVAHHAVVERRRTSQLRRVQLGRHTMLADDDGED